MIDTFRSGAIGRSRNDGLKDTRSVRIGRLWLLALFALALGIRCIGLLWGGKILDEDIGDPARVLMGHLIPAFQYYPPLLNYLTAAGYVVLYPIGILMGLWRTTAEFRDSYFGDPGPFLLVLRLVVSVAGALAAPLSALIASRLGLSRMRCLLVGVAMALLPISVWQSHIGKQDLGVAASALLAMWAMLRYTQDLRRADAVLFGVSLALALSFKQSAVFVLIPLSGALLLLAQRAGQSWSRLAQDTSVAAMVGIIVWVPLNIGLWLDLANFLDYQKVLAAMHVRNSGLQETLHAVWPRLTDRFTGPTLPLFVGFLIAPLSWRRHDVFWIWTSIMVSLVVTAAVSGGRADVQLYLPQSVLIGCIGIMTWISMAGRADWIRWPGTVGLVLAVTVLVTGTLQVDRQALAPSIRTRVAEALLKIDGIDKRRILASDVPVTGLPVAGDAERADMGRDEQMAQKYGVTLPIRYRPFAPDEGRYYVRSMPWVMGGLETYEEKDVKRVNPFAWPLQPDEWRLNHWLDTGHTVFVVVDEEAWLVSKVDAYRRLHQEIRARCKLVSTIAANRPLFGEHEIRAYVYDRL